MTMHDNRFYDSFLRQRSSSDIKGRSDLYHSVNRYWMFTNGWDVLRTDTVARSGITVLASALWWPAGDPHYFNICFDDVWRVIPFVFDPASPDDPDGYRAFKILLNAGKFAIVKPMFDQLDSPRTWWHSMFKRRLGIRLRFIHYTDMFVLQGQQCPDDDHSKVHTFVRSTDATDQGIDLLSLLVRM